MNLGVMIIIFGCAAYSVAVTKGKNPYLWFVVGLVLGPFAALILAFYPTKEKVKRIKPEPSASSETE